MSGSATGLVVYEPHHHGFKHAHVNAALLEAARLAVPGGNVVFAAHPSHTDWVRATLRDHGMAATGPTLPLHASPGGGRWRGKRAIGTDLRNYAYVLRAARAARARAVFVTSVTGVGVLALKMLTPWLSRRRPVVALVHQINDLLPGAGPETPGRVVRLARALRLPQPRGLRFLAPGPIALQGIRAHMPRLEPQFHALDLPYFFADEAEEPSVPTTGAPTGTERERARLAGELAFGFFGIARPENFLAFSKLASRVRAHEPRAQFRLVGFVRERELLDLPEAKDVLGLTLEPLSVAEFRRLAAAVDYAVWTRDSDTYRLRASASFLDAMSHVKPLISLESPFISDCFERMGDIGHLASEPQALEDTILGLLRAFSEDRYQRQRNNIRTGRRRFSPVAVGAALRAIVERFPSG